MPAVMIAVDKMSDSEREFVEGKLRQSIKEAADRAQKTNGWGTVSQDVTIASSLYIRNCQSAKSSSYKNGRWE